MTTSTLLPGLEPGCAGLDATPSPRVLVISYHFPPVGGAGVQRPLKFVKYLGRYGWTSTVLAASNPSVPVLDETLCAEIPPEALVERTRTWEPGYRVKQQVSGNPNGSGDKTGIAGGLKSQCLRVIKNAAGLLLQPDAQILWAPSAYGAAGRMLAQLPHDVLFATGPPYSNFVLGMALKRRFGLPLVLDFRDEWDLSSQYLENGSRSRWASFAQRKLQNAVLRAADAIVATTEASAERLERNVREAGGRANAFCIYNGYDAADVPANAASRRSSRDRFRLVYTGTLWNLTNVEPLVQAVHQLHARDPRITEKMELVVIGRKTPEQRAVLEGIARTGCQLTIEDYCSHDAALKWMAEADALCLLLSDVQGASRVVPAKLFEYLAVNREILAILPEGEAAGIVRRFWPQSHFLPGDTDGIARWLADRVLNPDLRGSQRSKAADVEQFRRDRQAGQLAAVFDEIGCRC